jgi:hypothetical protein
VVPVVLVMDCRPHGRWQLGRLWLIEMEYMTMEQRHLGVMGQSMDSGSQPRGRRYTNGARTAAKQSGRLQCLFSCAEPVSIRWPAIQAGKSHLRSFVFAIVRLHVGSANMTPPGLIVEKEGPGLITAPPAI